MTSQPSAASATVGPAPVKTTWLGLIGGTLAILCGAALMLAVLAAIAFGGAVALVGYPAATRFASSLGDPRSADQANFAIGLAAYLSLCLAVVAVAKLGNRQGWRERIGWRPWNPFGHTKLFLILFGLVLIYSLGADRLVTYLHPEAESWMPTPHGLVAGLLFVGLAAVLAPIGEELLFRGWLYTGLRGLIGIPAAIFLSAALFALAHWEETHLYALAVFPIGLALGFIREKTGSTKTSIAFHALYNGFAAALLLSK